MSKVYVKIDGIHCNHCIDVITNELKKNKKINDVKIKNNIAHITYNGDLTNDEIIDSINGIDYITKDEYISHDLKTLDSKIHLLEFILIIGIILLIWFLINKIFGFNIFNVIPNIDSNVTYGVLFVTGLLTSIHCISMCGAINLMAVVNGDKKTKFVRPLLYNLGRVISYTIIGGVVGLVGSVLSINDFINGIIVFVASIIMILMSLSMLGIINFRISFLNKIRIKNKSRNAFIIGLINGLMPCGPLQAMQVYALSTGSFFKGALSMMLFGLGTVPLMLGVGFIYNLFRGKRKILINKISSILILILSIVMLNRSLLMFNIDVFKYFKNYGDFSTARIVDDYQVIEFDLDYNNYQDILVQVGIPVKMIIHVDKKYLTGCNNEIISKEFDIDKKLEVGDNEIIFTPKEIGIFTYTCSMDMIKNNIKVIDDKTYFEVVK